MAHIEIEWHDNDKTILVWRFQETIDWEAFAEGHHRSFDMMDSVNHSVVQILDLTDVNGLPNNILSEGRRSAQRKPHPNMVQIVVVGLNPYLNAAINLFQKVLPKSMIDKWQMTFSDTIEDALTTAHTILQTQPASVEAKQI